MITSHIHLTTCVDGHPVLALRTLFKGKTIFVATGLYSRGASVVAPGPDDLRNCLRIVVTRTTWPSVREAAVVSPSAAVITVHQALSASRNGGGGGGFFLCHS